jgi:hypothetical protein
MVMRAARWMAYRYNFCETTPTHVSCMPRSTGDTRRRDPVVNALPEKVRGYRCLRRIGAKSWSRATDTAGLPRSSVCGLLHNTPERSAGHPPTYQELGRLTPAVVVYGVARPRPRRGPGGRVALAYRCRPHC